MEIKDFHRRVRLKDFFADQPQDPDFNPRLYVPTGWNPPRQNPELEDKLFPLRETLRRNFSESKPRWKDTLTRQERTELKELKNNQTVRVLPTDKKLGSALLSTDWMKNETLSHLYDDLSYSKVTLEEWYVYRDNVIKRREQLMLTYCQFLVPNVARFLHSYDHFVTPAKFSFIPKMIQLLEHTALPNTNCFLVTAVVVSLYPNVEIKKALVALDFLLHEAQAPETPLLIQLARLVLENNYLSTEFSSDIFHQKYGIPMGTPFAVTVANAFMYHHEKDIVAQYSNYLTLYRRFIDDIFAIWDGPKDVLLEFLDALNSKTDRIKLTYCISDSSISFLDLFLYRDISSSVLQFSTFQKPLNKYLYIPLESFHPSSNKKAFIKGELMRYARNSSSFKSFSETREKFWKRLRVRGYPFSFLLPLFREIRYSDRRR